MSLEALIDRYCECWADMSSSERFARLSKLLAEDAFYHDPTTKVDGVAELERHIAAVVAERPGSRVERTTKVDQHHEVARFGWNLVLANGEKLPEGIDVVWVTPDRNKLTGILGFFGQMKSRHTGLIDG